MEAYTPQVEHLMQRLYHSLSEKDRRRYAAVESALWVMVASPISAKF